MYGPLSAIFLDAIRAPHTTTTNVDHRNLITGVVTSLPVKDGSVTEDVTASNRWQLTSLTLPPTQPLFDLLDTPGGELTVTQQIRYANRDSETIPLGVYIVDGSGLGYASDGDISVTAADRSLKVQRNKLAPNQRASVASNTVWQEIQRLVEGAWPGSTYRFPGWAQLDKTATTKVGALVYDDGDRWTQIQQLCTDNSLSMFFNDVGLAVLRKRPTLSNTSVPVWTVDAGSRGVLIGADRDRDMSRTRNVVIVSTSATDVVFDPVVVSNTTSGDPLNTTGPLGYVPYEYSSPTLRNSSQARAAGLTILSRQLGTARQLTLEAVGNPALRVEDVIRAKLPKIDRNTPRPTELHMLDTVTHPLTAQGTQSLATRSTRPDTDGS